MQSQRCYQEKATTVTWQKKEMRFAKDNKERAHIFHPWRFIAKEENAILLWSLCVLEDDGVQLDAY